LVAGHYLFEAEITAEIELPILHLCPLTIVRNGDEYMAQRFALGYRRVMPYFKKSG
jgi:hypothetical protein